MKFSPSQSEAQYESLARGKKSKKNYVEDVGRKTDTVRTVNQHE